MSDGNEIRQHTADYGVELDWALRRMQLTFPYNTQLGAVPYRMVMKRCISSTFYSQFTGCLSLGISLLLVIRTT